MILARVSTKEQEDGHSLEAQRCRLEQYCQKKSLNIIKAFELTESSTRGNRKDFMQMINFIHQQVGIVALVADKVDRVQRSFNEYPLLNGLLEAGKIELHFNTENYVIHKESRSTERTIWSMSVLMAQSYTDSMSDNIKRSLEHKRKKGEWSGLPPLGYLNSRDERGNSIIVIDHVRAPIIQRLFCEYVTGARTYLRNGD